MRNSNNILALFALLLSTLPASAQFGGQSVAAGSWEPLAIRTKAGIVAQYAPGRDSTVTLNGAGVSQVQNRLPSAAAATHLAQATALNQPLISRADNAGNLLVQSETFENASWVKSPGGTGTLSVTATNYADATYPNCERLSLSLNGGTLAADFAQFQQTSPVLAPGVYASYIWIRSTDGVSSYTMQLVQDAAGSTSAGGAITVTGSWQRFDLTQTIAAQAATILKLRLRGGQTPTNSDSADVLVYGASLRPASWDSTYVATVATPAIAGLAGRKTLYMDGAAYYLKSGAFTLNQPTEVYRLCLPWTWTLNDTAFDGNSSGSGKLYQSATTPKIRFNAGTDGTELTPPALGSWRLTSVVFDGSSSRISTNRGDYVVSDAGAGNMGGFTLGANGANTAFWHGQVAGQVLCNKTNLTQESRYLQWGYLKQANAL